MLNRVYLLLGSNMGNREALIADAAKLLANELLPSISAALEALRKQDALNGAATASCKEGSPEEAAQLMPLYVLSDVAETEPWGFEAETKFLNMVLSVKTLKEPLEILDICQNIERILGRDRAAEGPRYDNEGRRIYHSRLIDIDLLYCEEALGFGRWREIRMEHPRLQLPHPKLPERAFAQELLRNVIVKENHKFVLR